MKILVINAGSSSLKYQLFDMDGERVLAKGICERIGIDGHLKGSAENGGKVDLQIPMNDHVEAFNIVVDTLTKGDCKVIDSLNEINAVGHRVVQGGSLYNHSVIIDKKVIDDIRSLSVLAPLHNPAHVQGIDACTAVLGDKIPQVAVFDNAFHSTMPDEAYMFAVPYEYFEKYGIRRYGFHGTSHRYVSAECIKKLGGKPGTKIITCHLGNGCSITAIRDGKVIDTSMGLTPLDGFMMGTRSGAVDPSVITFLQDKEGWTPAQTDAVLNKKSGVLGISGLSSDDRDVLAASETDARADLARRMQRYQIKKYIGSYIAALGGVDAIVFTGGVGENTVDLRKYLCESFSYLGIEIDDRINETARKGVEGELTKPGSRVRVFVIPTNEELVIARDTLGLAKA